MEKYTVSVMTCAACSSRVEKAVSKVKGVKSCSVNLLTGSMSVEGSASESDIIGAVTKAGYGAKKSGSRNKSGSPKESLIENTSAPLIRRLIFSSIFLLILMYFSMGHMMWGWKIPPFFEGNHIAVGLLEMILSAIVMLINNRFFISGTKAVLHGGPNMDTLVALGSGISFIYSTAQLFLMSDAHMRGDMQAVTHSMENLYFEGAAMIVTLITIGKMLESISKGHTTSALKSLMDLSPKTANVIREGKEQTIPADEIQTDDIFIVRPGESIPTDGIIIEGNASIDESSLTGESIPAEKKEGDQVFQATVSASGFLRCRATKVGEDTSLSKIIRMVSDATATKAPIARIADKVSGFFVPAVILIAALTCAVWILLGKELGFALSRGICVLVISCPCALGLATPVAIMVGSGKAARNGILFKTSAALEEISRSEIVVLDKTGTITQGKPSLTDIISLKPFSEKELLQVAMDLESMSEHPISKAIMEKCLSLGMSASTCRNFKSIPGKGLSCERDGQKLSGGNSAFIAGLSPLDKELLGKGEKLSEEGKTAVYFCMDGKCMGLIAVADKIKDDSRKAVESLSAMGLSLVMLTGDNERTAKSVARDAGIKHVIPEVLPDQKADTIRSLQRVGKVCMVGDGINDAPSLTVADTGIAIGAGTDIAIEAADVVLTSSSLTDVSSAILMGRKCLTNIRENLFWAFFYNAILIPVAAGSLSSLGIVLNPMLGAAAMSLSSFCVVMNALRLNLADISGKRKPRKIKRVKDESVEEILGSLKKKTIQEPMETTPTDGKKENIMEEKTIGVEGMMCSHCEAHVKEALEKIDGVSEAKADHEKKQVVLKLTNPVSDEEISEAVKAAGYEMIS